MTEQQIELLAELQRLAMACSTQTGARVYHSIEAWPEGGVWSEVRIIRDGGKPPHLDTVVEITAAGIERRVITTHTIETLSEQRDALADWIAANRIAKTDPAACPRCHGEGVDPRDPDAVTSCLECDGEGDLVGGKPKGKEKAA